MRILMLHNAYHQEKGGEDVSFDADCELLESGGHNVARLVHSNSEAVEKGPLALASALWRSSWNRRRYKEVLELCLHFRPDVAHVNNFWFDLSPSVHAACHDAGVPTVQNLRNFRLLCAGATLLRDGRICEDCIGKSLWRGVYHCCYQKSFLRSLAVFRMVQANRRRGTWESDVDAFVALTEHGRKVFVRGGFPGERIHVRGNFLFDPGIPSCNGVGGIYVGRMSEEKGVRKLIRAWQGVGGQLTMVGDGPLADELQRYARQNDMHNVRFLGALPKEECCREIANAAFLILPSDCYETFGRTIVEAFACQRPVLCSDHGAMATLVDAGETGLTFVPGDACDLERKANKLCRDGTLCGRMGKAARAVYEQSFSPKASLPLLLDIYDSAVRKFRSSNNRGRSQQPKS